MQLFGLSQEKDFSFHDMVIVIYKVKYLLCCMNSVSNNNDLTDIWDISTIIDAISYSK